MLAKDTQRVKSVTGKHEQNNRGDALAKITKVRYISEVTLRVLEFGLLAQLARAHP